ncbi:asparagine synthase-related protein [Methanosarcina barkeri]|uniref:asparagine synthase-related protein n=1 Tax=Methanosarcina barkeri TaxID=2208 RepID=UPI00373FE099
MIEKIKKGFPTPTNEWFKKFNQEIRDILLDPVAVERGIYNTEYVEKILKKYKRVKGIT